MSKAAVVNVTSLEDLALLNEDNAIRILVNGTEKFLAKDWIDGADARGSDSVLSKSVLGTKEGLSGKTEIEVEESLATAFDLLLLWLALGDSYVSSSLNDENASNLHGLASYFGLEHLVTVIEKEKEDREEKERKKEAAQRLREAAERQRQARLERERSMRSRGYVKCVACGEFTTVAPNYRGNTPRCWDCRAESFDHGYDYDYESDGYRSDGYHDCDSWY